MAELEPQFLEIVSTSALELRQAFDGVQAGVWGGGDLKVTAGAVGRSVDVAAGSGYVDGSHVSDQGRYRIRNDAVKNSEAFTLGGIPANATGLPRIDQIIARIYDQTHDNSGQRKWQLEVLPGVATSGATLTNRTGAAALPLSSLRLADFLTPNGATSILAANILDRRPWARGAYRRIMRTAGNYTLSAGATALVDATNLQPRIECSGVPLRVTLHGLMNINPSTASVTLRFNPTVDGVALTDGPQFIWTVYAAIAADEPAMASWTLSPSAGSHLIGLAATAPAGPSTSMLYASAGQPAVLTIEEIVRPSADNT